MVVTCVGCCIQIEELHFKVAEKDRHIGELQAQLSSVRRKATARIDELESSLQASHSEARPTPQQPAHNIWQASLNRPAARAQPTCQGMFGLDVLHSFYFFEQSLPRPQSAVQTSSRGPPHQTLLQAPLAISCHELAPLPSSAVHSQHSPSRPGRDAQVRQLRKQIAALEESNSSAGSQHQASLERWQKLEGQAADKNCELQSALRKSAEELQAVEQSRAELHAKYAALSDRAHRAKHEQEKLRKEVREASAACLEALGSSRAGCWMAVCLLSGAAVCVHKALVQSFCMQEGEASCGAIKARRAEMQPFGSICDQGKSANQEDWMLSLDYSQFDDMFLAHKLSLSIVESTTQESFLHHSFSCMDVTNFCSSRHSPQTCSHDHNWLRLQAERAQARAGDLERQLRDRAQEAQSQEASRSRTEQLLVELRNHMRSDSRTAQEWLLQELQSQVRHGDYCSQIKFETPVRCLHRSALSPSPAKRWTINL